MKVYLRGLFQLSFIYCSCWSRCDDEIGEMKMMVWWGWTTTREVGVLSVHIREIRCGRADNGEVLLEQQWQSCTNAIGTMVRSRGARAVAWWCDRAIGVDDNSEVGVAWVYVIVRPGRKGWWRGRSRRLVKERPSRRGEVMIDKQCVLERRRWWQARLECADEWKVRELQRRWDDRVWHGRRRGELQRQHGDWADNG
jgi:hypothetical protein